MQAAEAELTMSFTFSPLPFSSCHTTQGYHGTALGKNKQAAHAEIEKLDLKELSARELLKEAARMCVAFGLMLPLSKDCDLF